MRVVGVRQWCWRPLSNAVSVVNCFDDMVVVHAHGRLVMWVVPVNEMPLPPRSETAVGIVD